MSTQHNETINNAKNYFLLFFSFEFVLALFWLVVSCVSVAFDVVRVCCCVPINALNVCWIVFFYYKKISYTFDIIFT